MLDDDSKPYIIDEYTDPLFFASSWPTTGRGHELLGDRAAYRLPSIAPQSIFVCVISNDWMENGWWRLQDMLAYTEEAGYMVTLQEMDDASLLPADAIGVMRECGALMALDSGHEWCFMIDTDILLEKDTLIKLLQWDMPVVYPLLLDLEMKFPGAGLTSPKMKPDTGLQPATWGAMSAMLFNTKVFNCLPPGTWLGHDYHFAQFLGHYGHRIHIDTDTIVNIQRGPARNLAKPWNEIWEHLEEGYTRRMIKSRDRRPPPEFDAIFGEGTITEDGCYWAVKSDFRSKANTPWKDHNNWRENVKPSIVNH